MEINRLVSIKEAGKAKEQYCSRSHGKTYLKVERKIYLGAPAGHFKSTQTVILRSPGVGGMTKNLVRR
jgi:hypothetical protein